MPTIKNFYAYVLQRANGEPFYVGKGSLVNRTSGGQGSSGRTFSHTEETKARIRASCTGQKRSEKTLAALKVAAQKRHSDPVYKEFWNKLVRSPKTFSAARLTEMSVRGKAQYQARLKNSKGQFQSG